MNNKVYLISGVSFLIIILAMILIYYKQNCVSDIYKEYQYPNEDFFGKELYSEIDYKCSEYELEIANMVIDRAKEVSDYIDIMENAESKLGDVGALSRYYYFNSENAVMQDVDFQIVTCKINSDEGHVWVVYNLVRYDKEGEPINSCSDILTLWNIEKYGDEWRVVQVREAP